MENTENQSNIQHNDEKTAVSAPRQVKLKPAKPLPTDRLSLDSQLSVLRAYAAASGPSKQLVSNSDVEKISGISASSVSVCNPFFNDIGLIIREGIKVRPAQAVFDYSHSQEWGASDATNKLAVVIEKTWFAEALLPKLSFRPLTRDEATTYLAEESTATLDYKRQLELLIDYLEIAGLINVEGNSISKCLAKRVTAESVREPVKEDKVETAATAKHPDNKNADTFTIPIPGKEPVIVSVPKDLDVDDWAMFATMLEIYIKRLKKWSSDQLEAASKNHTGGETT